MLTTYSLRRSEVFCAIIIALLLTISLRADDEATFHLAFDEATDAGVLVEGVTGQATSLTGEVYQFDPHGKFNPACGTASLHLLDLDFNGQYAKQKRNVLRIRSGAFYLQLMVQDRYLYWRLYLRPDDVPVKDQPFEKLYKVILSPRGQFPVGQWCHVVASWDVQSRTLRLSANGIESPPITFDMIGDFNPMQLLIDQPAKRGEIGSNGDSMFVIDELKVYDSVREDLLRSAAQDHDDATKHGSRVSRDWKPSLEVESPHVPWLKPYAGGKLKVLIVQPWVNLREAVELAQRLDVELDVLPVTSFDRRCIGAGPMHRYEREDFLKKVKTNDVIILAGIAPQWFDKASWAALLAAVDTGKGVVWPIANMTDDPRIAELLSTQIDTPDYARRGVPHDNLIIWRDVDKEFTFIKRGKGRMVLCNTHGHLFTRYSSMAPIYYGNDGEHYYALLSRLAVWTAQREPDITVEVARNLGFVAGGDQDWTSQQVLITVPAEADGRASRIDLTVRDVSATWYYDENGRHKKPGIRHIGESSYPTVYHTSHPITLARGTMELSCAFGVLPCGRYTLDAQLYDEKGRAIDWDSALVLVDANPRMVWLQPSEPAFAPGTTAQIEHRFQNVQVTSDTQLRWRIVDIYDREIARGAESYNGQETQTVSFAMPDNFTRGVYYEAATYRDGQPLQVMRTHLLLPRRRAKPFYYVIYGALQTRLADLGVDALVGGGARADKALVENDAEVFYWINAPGLTVDQSPDDTVRQPTLNSTAWRKQVDVFLAKYAKALAYQKPIGGVIIDEWEYASRLAAKPFHDLDHNPESIAAFRAFLQEEYANSLAALNETWGENYATWDDVEMKLNKDVDVKTNPAPSVDRMRFTESVVADAIGYINDAARQYDPDVRLGLSGTRPARGYNGYDYYKLMTGGADAIVNYGRPMPEASRSFAGAREFVATWQGYGSNFRPTAAAQIWRQFILGHDAYINYSTYPDRSLHMADWTLSPGAAPRRDVYRELDAGIAQLVRGGERQRDALAIHYSQASRHMLPLDVANITEKTYFANLSSLIQLFEDAGIEPRFVATEQINSGQLTDLGVQILFLPMSTAIGDQEAVQLKAFVHAGGTIIADTACGLRDRHGRPRGAGALDDLFGIQRDGEPRHIGKLGDLDDQSKAIVGESNLIAPNAKRRLTYGDQTNIPALIETRHGPGRAMYLNFTFSDYNTVNAGGVGGELDMITHAKAERRAEVQQQFRDILADSQITPAVRIVAETNENGLRLETLTTRYIDGEAMYVLVQANHVDAIELSDRATNEAVIHLPRQGHVYDVRRGLYLGDTDRIDVTLLEGDAHVFAILPRQVKAMSIHLDQSRRAPGQTLTYTINTDAGVRHVSRVTVTGPDGKLRRAYTANVVSQGSIPLALNDSLGMWRIDARDVATGLTTTATFQVH